MNNLKQLNFNDLLVLDTDIDNYDFNVRSCLKSVEFDILGCISI